MVHAIPAAPSSSSDERLLNQFVDGQSFAAERIYKKYAERIRALARARVNADLTARVDADDVVQSVFRAFFHNAAKGNYDVPQGGDLWQLLAVVTINKVRSLYEHHQAALRNARQTTELPDDFTGNTVNDQGPLEFALREILQQLPDAEREIVQYRLDGYEIAEIAIRTRRSRRTVERLLQKARMQLDDLLKVSHC
jgi:RNA polymerase sigma-70 factor, ECF subfamily